MRVRDMVQQAADQVLAAAGDTRRAIVALGAGLLAVALIAVAALVLAARAGRKLAAA